MMIQEKMVSFKLALLTVVTVLLGGSASIFEAAGSDECTSGFLDFDSINETNSMIAAFPDSSLPMDELLFDFTQWIFPNINFTCDGYIMKWRLRVNASTESINEIMQQPSPHVTVWQLQEEISFGIVANYALKNVANESQRDVIVVNGSVYIEYTPLAPIQVQAGDIIGIMMPESDDDRVLSVRPLFLRLPEEDTSTFSCVRVGNNQEILLQNQMCPILGEWQSGYIPLVSLIFNLDMPSSVLPPLTMAPSSTQPSITMDPTPPANPTTTLQDTATDSTTIDLPAPPQPGANSNQLVGVIIGAILAALSLVLIVVLAIFLVLLLTKRRSQKLYDVPIPPQRQNMDNPVYTGGTAESNGLGRTNVYATPSPTQLESPHPLETNIVAEHYEFSQDVVPASYEQPMYELEPGGGPDEPAYAQPTPFSRSTTLTQPYEVPLSALSTLASTRDESSLDRHTYSILEAGLYVPTEAERQSLRRPPTSKSSTGTSTGVFDEEIYARMSKKYRNRLDETAFFEQEEVYWEPASSQTALYDQLSKKKYREILRQQIQIIKHLGAGQFGTVSKGLWESPYGSMEVAVKMLQPQASDRDKKVKFLQEAAIMGQFLHPNIVKLHGVVTVNEPVMIVLEYMNKGDLREYLISQRPKFMTFGETFTTKVVSQSVPLHCIAPVVTVVVLYWVHRLASIPTNSKLGDLKEGGTVFNDLPQRFLKFCREIASGMNYLSNKAFVHRDLAARNILVSEDETCKIGDFGMSRDLEDNSYYITHGGKIPVKWTAPEALHFRKYSTASDVWSFGCVMYEIWSLGHKPFESYSNIQAMQMIGSGYRLPPPPGCPRPLYSLMIRCWHSDASNRPLFSAIFKMLGHLDSDLLSWSEKDKAIHPQAANLGAPLEAGDELYTDLQDYYLDEASKRQ